MKSGGAMSIAKKISQKKQLIQEFFLSKSLHTLENVLLSIRLPRTTVPYQWRQDSTFVYEYGEGHPAELFWWNYLLIMQRPARKDSFLENKCHIMPTFSCEFVLISRVQSLHESSQLFAQDGRHWTNGWRDQSVLVNFICIYGRLRHLYRI